MSVFDGRSGRKPQTEARMWVYRTIASVLDNDTEQSRDGWFGLPDGDEFDRRRLAKAIASVTKEMIRKGGGDPRLSAQGPFETLTVDEVRARMSGRSR